MAKSVLKWNEFGPTDARSYQAITDHLPGGRSQFIIQKVFKTYALRDFGITASRWVNHGSFKTPASAKKYARELLENYPVMKANPAPKRKTAARTQRAAESYVRRPSQITKKAPSKRLKKRRTVNLQSPRGVFPNPSMSAAQVRKAFNAAWRERVRYVPAYKNDIPAKREFFSTFIDGLYEDGLITERMLNNVTMEGAARKNPDSVHFDIDVNSHNAKGAKAGTRVNPVARQKITGLKNFIVQESAFSDTTGFKTVAVFAKVDESFEYAKARDAKNRAEGKRRWIKVLEG